MNAVTPHLTPASPLWETTALSGGTQNLGFAALLDVVGQPQDRSQDPLPPAEPSVDETQPARRESEDVRDADDTKPAGSTRPDDNKSLESTEASEASETVQGGKNPVNEESLDGDHGDAGDPTAEQSNTTQGTKENQSSQEQDADGVPAERGDDRGAGRCDLVRGRTRLAGGHS